jgi:pimeloyl-ACP methyl ester carboxylesterase
LAHPPAAEPATLAHLPVLFIPGTLCTAAVFESQINELKPLAPQVDVVRFTLEDSISSMADTVIELIPPGSGAAIIGFSMGGMVAMELARRAPELIKKLALINTNFHADLEERQSERSRYQKLAETEGIENVIRQYYLDSYLHQHTTNAADLIVKMAGEMGRHCFASQIKALTNRQDSSATLSAIACPTLIVGAKQDELCPPSGQIQMQRMISDSELVLLGDCGHFSTLEKPKEVNKALCKWYLQS